MPGNRPRRPLASFREGRQVTFAVMAELNDGKTAAIRRGFPTREAAEDYPVKLSLWKRVWIEREPDAPVYTDPPQPWTVEWIRGFAYVLAADGRKIASLLGPQRQREYVAAIICNAASGKAGTTAESKGGDNG